MQTDNGHAGSQERSTYVVLGATGGIGSALCRLLAADGARLVLAARGEERLAELAEEIGGRTHSLDATDYEAVHALVEQTVEDEGSIDGVVNCVGSILIKPAHLTSIDEFERVLSVNLRTAFNVVKAAARPMMTGRGGAIVLCSSAVATKGIANHEAIAAAKAGVAGLARSAAATYAHRNVRVNAVAPGLVETPQSASILRSDAARSQSEAMHALGRLGTPRDVAAAIQWLLDPRQGSWVTGQVIGVDGGLGAVQPRTR